MKSFFTFFFCLALSWTTYANAQNLIAGWDGNGITGDSSKPTDVGWLNTVSASIPWNTANGGGGCRFRDAGSGFTAGTFKNEDGSINDSRHLMLRFDNDSYSSSVYAYPVTLAANSTYDFSLDYLCGGSGTPPLNLTIGASTTASAAGQIIAVAKATTNSTTTYRRATVSFATTSAGVYYITFSGDRAWFGITNLNLVKSNIELTELNKQYNKLTFSTLSTSGDSLKITSNLNLPTTLGSNGVTVSWTSSNPSVISETGTVTQPEKYNAGVILNAKVSQLIGDSTYTMSKAFKLIVLGVIPTPEELAQWDFNNSEISVNNGVTTVQDVNSGFVGTLHNEARIRTIGTGDEQFNVLDLGNGTGYFDMGTEIGKAIYSLTNYTVCGYFRVEDDYSNLSGNGNFYWTFSNSEDSGVDKNGYMIGRLNNQSHSVSTNYYNLGNQSTTDGTVASKGAWHHIAYVQEGNTGKIYIDGELKATNTEMTNLPAFAIAKTGFTGTLHNWLGRSNFPSDSYLRKTLLYDFRVLASAISAVDINLDYLNVPNTIDQLNTAYSNNPDYIANELTTEKDNLNLGNLSAVKENLTLPTTGTLDPTISITWKSSNTNLIDASGIVTRPDFYNYTDTLTAVLVKNGQAVTKKFYATVVAKDGTPFTNNLLVKYDFSQVSGTTVTDVAEKQFRGELKEDASIAKIGTTTEYKVLSLGDSIGYFDMGEDVGKILYNLQDFTIGAYYRIDQDYDDSKLSANGNFLWSFSNATDILSNASGYLIASLKNQTVTISPTNWEKESSVAYQKATKGSWHHLAYTQSGTTGTIYVDGMPVATGTVAQLPANTLAKEGLLGTAYNWIGRSCYKGDLYLRQTLVYDFRVYDVALTADEIQTSKLNVGNTITALDRAYEEGITSSLASVVASPYQLFTGKGTIHITGLNGTEKIQVLDLSGRNVTTTNQATIALKSGLYIVKINNSIFKAYVK